MAGGSIKLVPGGFCRRRRGENLQVSDASSFASHLCIFRPSFTFASVLCFSLAEKRFLGEFLVCWEDFFRERGVMGFLPNFRARFRLQE